MGYKFQILVKNQKFVTFYPKYSPFIESEQSDQVEIFQLGRQKSRRSVDLRQKSRSGEAP